MKLVPIPENKYDDYRVDAMFDCYKWDPQFLDHNTIAKHVLVITKEEYEELKNLTEALDKETRAAEEFLCTHLEYAKALDLSKKLSKELSKMKNYDSNQHIRLMRYDFHPTTEGWMISEVNSDVPGGYAEATLLPQLAKDTIEANNYWFNSFGDTLANAIAEKTPAGGKIMLVHCTCYSDDRQVMECLGDELEERGFTVIYGAADHLKFQNDEAISILSGNEGKVDAIVRFSPLEWVKDMNSKDWKGYFNTKIPSCNHPIAIFAQTKKFPFVWDILEQNNISMKTWRKLLPDTISVKEAKDKEGYIYKPAYGRVGENIGIKEACNEKEYKNIIKEVKLLPNSYIAQKKFTSIPLTGSDNKEYHVCIGSYTVNGKHAGFYARIADVPRIDSNAADIPVLIEGEYNNDK